ncbi:VlmB-like protein [Solihabitans fulvus]|uniref:VlmB-like protein n=1 Tax=Solihabitans fulvus TaxID=1892852 RepID=A0A5B2WFP5_9PSEU|nr:VlmB-like protein [Solihabitans fulvus]
MTAPTSPEADWNSAPNLIDGAMTLDLTPQQCNLDYWITSVAQGTLQGLVGGHRPEAQIPAYMREPGPLRDALISELGFRSIAEEKATRAISDLVAIAPDLDTMEFYATQLIDEARHSRVFRGHLVELGVPERDLAATIEATSGKDIAQVLVPLEEFSEPVRQAKDFVGGVIVLTVLVEGVLAPAAELSERKWRKLDPAAAEIERGAGIDEIRHLTVGSSVVRDYLKDRPDEKPRLAELIARGQELWGSVPVLDMLLRREALFQEGLLQHTDVVGDYEIWPGRRLVETTPEERIEKALGWSLDMQQTRMAYMGLA